jgi:hypothetical protein
LQLVIIEGFVDRKMLEKYVGFKVERRIKLRR